MKTITLNLSTILGSSLLALNALAAGPTTKPTVKKVEKEPVLKADFDCLKAIGASKGDIGGLRLMTTLGTKLDLSKGDPIFFYTANGPVWVAQNQFKKGVNSVRIKDGNKYLRLMVEVNDKGEITSSRPAKGLSDIMGDKNNKRHEVVTLNPDAKTQKVAQEKYEALLLSSLQEAAAAKKDLKACEQVIAKYKINLKGEKTERVIAEGGKENGHGSAQASSAKVETVVVKTATTQPAKKVEATPVKAATQPATQPTSRPVATTQPSTRPVAATQPSKTERAPATAPSTQPSTKPSTNPSEPIKSSADDEDESTKS